MIFFLFVCFVLIFDLTLQKEVLCQQTTNYPKSNQCKTFILYSNGFLPPKKLTTNWHLTLM